MRSLTTAAWCLVVGSMASMAVQSQPRDSAVATIYEGARLLIGDASAPIDVGAFVVQGGRFTAVGRKGAVSTPPGAAHVNLTGKTVMPAMVNAHVHFGYEKFTKAEGESLPGNFRPRTCSTTCSARPFTASEPPTTAGPPRWRSRSSSDRTSRQECFRPPPGFSSTRGLCREEAVQTQILIKGTRPLHANYEVVRATEARAAVQDVAAKGIRSVKIWLGDRGGSYPAMPHEVYDAVIDEAHRHGIMVHAHATTLRDQKDVFAEPASTCSCIRFRTSEVDDELSELDQGEEAVLGDRHRPRRSQRRV